MAQVLAVVHLPHVSGVPDDEVQNSFVFTNTAGTLQDLLADLDSNEPIQSFYNASFTGMTRQLADYISDVISRASGVASIEMFDITLALDGSPHGSPVAISSFTLDPPPVNTQSLPAEACGVLTLYGTGRTEAPVESGPTDIPNTSREIAHGAPATHTGNSRPKQSRTGRLYIGPLNTLAMTGLTTEIRLSSEFVADLAIAAHGAAFNLGGSNTSWAVWSRRQAAVYPIFGGHVDNAFDIQRRRGVKPTLRAPWAL